MINQWTKKKKMALNEKKTKNMIFNFTKKMQFTTKLSVNEKPIEIVKKAFKRMQLLTRAASFTSSKKDLRKIYLIFIRSILEQSAVVWHSSLSLKNKKALERVQNVL